MYDMRRVSADGHFGTMDADERDELRRQFDAQRVIDANGGRLFSEQS